MLIGKAKVEGGREFEVKVRRSSICTSEISPVCLVWFIQPNKQGKPNKPINEIDPINKFQCAMCGDWC
jgi:hypothetical protein